MTPEEALFLKVYGECVVLNFFMIAVQTVLSAIGLVLYAVSTVMLSRRPVKGNGTIFLLVLITFSFLIMLLDWVMFVIDISAVSHIGLVGLPGSNIATQFLAVFKHNDWIYKLSDWPLQIHLLICDTIVISRVWAMFPESRRERWFTVFLLSADIAVNVGYGFHRTTLSYGIPPVDPWVMVTDWHITGMIISLVTNLVATGFIGWKAWRHRQSLMRSGFSPKSKHSPVQRILALFLESGIAFMILQIIVIVAQFIPTVVRTTLDAVLRCMMKAFTALASMYPSIVIIIVERSRGILDETQYFGEGEVTFGDGRNGGGEKTGHDLSQIRFESEMAIPVGSYQSRRSAVRTQEFVVSLQTVLAERT
ncbi:hypothetical protein DL96DRAFT_1824926, partial [Flagelloscypha sp. PMI_526]